MKGIYYFCFCFILVLNTIVCKAQTNPKPFDLSKGDYSFTGWSPYAPAKTYPHNMIFQNVLKNYTEPFYSDGEADYTCQYNRTTGSRINGLGNDGFGFATSSAPGPICDSLEGRARYTGIALISLKTKARKEIQICWESGTVEKGDAEIPRECVIRLQYRIGDYGDFIDVPGNVEYKTKPVEGDTVTLGPITLPFECDNQDLVQLRWIYFENAKNGGGTRPQIRVNNVSITSLNMSKLIVYPPLKNANPVLINSEILTLDLNNYYTNDKYEINLYTLVGKSVYNKFTDNQFIKINTGRLIKGAYIISLRNTDKNTIVNQKLFIE